MPHTPTYQNQYRLRTSDFNIWGQIQPASVLDLFQDVAGSHARELGIAFGPESGTSLIWVLAKVKYEVVQSNTKFRNVTVKTWPLPPTGINFRRDYMIFDENGDVIIKGTSEWVVVDAIKRKIVIKKDVYPLSEAEFCRDLTFDGKLPRLNVQELQGVPYCFTPGYSDIDENRHVNNTKYANYIMNALAPKENNVIRSFRIDYHKEIMQGEEIALYTQGDASTVLGLGKNAVGENMFSCEIELY